jgi:glycerol-3-phosphate acyltransferase PlsY
MLNALYLLASYLIGSLSAAILVCRALGKGDPRTVGSGNPGATNVLRAFGKGPALATLAGDVLKGFVPVVVGPLIGLQPIWVAAAGTAAFMGHLYPAFFGFKGGKGVATLVGVMLGYDWRLGLAFVVTWLAVAAVTRYSSLAALCATTAAPLFAVLLALPLAYAGGLGVMGIAVFWRHRDNMARLRTGTEGRIGAKNRS